MGLHRDIQNIARHLSMRLLALEAEVVLPTVAEVAVAPHPIGI